MDKTVHLDFIYGCLEGANINLNRIFQFYDSMNDFMSIFSMKLLGFVSKAIKLLLTELVGQCRNILPLAFSSLTSLRSVNTEKAAGNIFLH